MTDRERPSLEALVEPTLDALGYTLVRVQLSGGQRHRTTLQVMAERRDGAPMSVEDCATISRALSAKLDVEDPIQGAYSLEVSSPGIDRPLVRPDDYRRFAGFEARVETRAAIDGRRRFRGRILVASETHVRLRLSDPTPGECEIAFADIEKAKLVLNDELLQAAAAPRH